MKMLERHGQKILVIGDEFGAATVNTLELRGITMDYGTVKALDNIQLTVTRGEWLAIMGPSGSGKTTLMNIIGCMDKPSSGAVVLDGVDLSTLPAKGLTAIRRDKIGLVFQQFHLVPYLTALENIMVAQYYHSMPDETEALTALERVGLKERARHLPSQLSGGEQQRVCIARALINYPALILADEPTGNLDEANQTLVLEIFQALHREGHTIITVTHDPEVAERAERCIVLGHGRITGEQRCGQACG
ncbi:putative ABC transporter ATP-binding protein YknY [Sporomusa aerivorans]